MPKTAVLIIDMQKDFTKPNGKFYYPQTTGPMMETFSDKLDRMRALGAWLIHVYTVHPKDEKEINPELTHMFVNGKKASLLAGTEGAEIDESISFVPGKDIRFQKNMPSAFFKTDLDELLRQHGVQNVLVCGLKTNVCVRATATDAYQYRYRTYLISDMVSTNTKEINEFHLQEMTKYFAKAISSDEVISRLENGGF